MKTICHCCCCFVVLVLNQVTHFIPFAVTKRVNKITEYTMRSEVHKVALLRFVSSGVVM